MSQEDGASVLKWEKLEDSHARRTEKGVREERVYIHRAKVLGGWLVKSIATYEMQRKFKQESGEYDFEAGAGVGMGITFVPDPDHAWNPADYR